MFFALLTISLVKVERLCGMVGMDSRRIAILRLMKCLKTILCCVTVGTSFKGCKAVTVVVDVVLVLFICMFNCPGCRTRRIVTTFFKIMCITIVLSFVCLAEDLPSKGFLM